MTHELVGNVGVTVLNVYDDPPGPDGVRSGCAHVHGLTDEAYFGVAGEGAIELHDPENGYRRIPITRGTYVQFPPWTLHRSVSTGALEVLALMGNQGLAERGDARIFFGEEADGNPARFEELKALVRSGMDGAIARRDQSSLAYMELMRLWRDDKDGYRVMLLRFFDRHRETIAATPELNQAALRRTADADTPVSAVGRWSAVGAETTLGMCGLLRQINTLDNA